MASSYDERDKMKVIFLDNGSLDLDSVSKFEKRGGSLEFYMNIYKELFPFVEESVKKLGDNCYIKIERDIPRSYVDVIWEGEKDFSKITSTIKKYVYGESNKESIDSANNNIDKGIREVKVLTEDGEFLTYDRISLENLPILIKKLENSNAHCIIKPQLQGQILYRFILLPPNNEEISSIFKEYSIDKNLFSDVNKLNI